MAQNDSLLTAVRDVLFREWDPIGVNGNEDCRGEYDSYAPTLCRWLREGADEFKLASHLEALQHTSMGISRVNNERDRNVARSLLALVPEHLSE